MEVEYRKLNYSDRDEVLEFSRLFWAVPPELGDSYIRKKDDEEIQRYAEDSIVKDNESNTCSLLAISDGSIVGLHVLRRFEEHNLVGAHIANLWVHEDCRSQGIARRLKEMGEGWAVSVGADFLNTNVMPDNDRMIGINEGIGFISYRICMRKRLKE